MPGARSYHHGDLRRAVLDAAIDVITTEGPGSLSLRDLARRAGVSHAAPAHHFTDKAGVLTALAVEGHELLGDAFADVLDAGPAQLQELGVRYVRFALQHPAHFEVMFRPDLHRRDSPELLAAQERTGGLLRAGVAAVPADRRGQDTELATIAAWSLAHGFASLWRGDNLGRLAGRRPPEEVFRAAAELLFGQRP
ncbi:TetR/AcrR family transcriptional regulator [Prauserella cavernicola]|uniref:TetR/AcrR family transcriptional regulator n=1 Tax=Prauserella cavernicola TaxID=2800127 RepID=A0A934QM30_9PSEU|nr:TetR/AcrR family transcriptional regulator [Prauserella cavernicola]MBK1782766.1 TetR/AcrR family transcriptional regulator [Prauserella cavernicola]